MVRRTATGQDDLFSVAPAVFVRQSLAGMDWPSSSLFPVNHARVRVADVVWADVRDSDEALVLAGFASIAELVELAASRCQDGRIGQLRVLLGTEPFSTQRVSFGSPGGGVH